MCSPSGNLQKSGYQIYAETHTPINANKPYNSGSRTTPINGIILRTAYAAAILSKLQIVQFMTIHGFVDNYHNTKFTSQLIVRLRDAPSYYANMRSTTQIGIQYCEMFYEALLFL